MRKNEKITTIMTASPTTVQVGQPLSEASRIMKEGAFHHVPVVDGTTLVGILSTTDLLKVSYVYGTDAREVDAVLDATVELKSLMQSDPVTLKTNQTVRDAVDVFAEGQFHSMPVVDDSGALAGIVTTTDVLRYMRDQY